MFKHLWWYFFWVGNFHGFLGIFGVSGNLNQQNEEFEDMVEPFERRGESKSYCNYEWKRWQPQKKKKKRVSVLGVSWLQWCIKPLKRVCMPKRSNWILLQLVNAIGFPEQNESSKSSWALWWKKKKHVITILQAVVYINKSLFAEKQKTARGTWWITLLYCFARSWLRVRHTFSRWHGQLPPTDFFLSQEFLEITENSSNCSVYRGIFTYIIVPYLRDHHHFPSTWNNRFPKKRKGNKWVRWLAFGCSTVPSPSPSPNWPSALERQRKVLAFFVQKIVFCYWWLLWSEKSHFPPHREPCLYM